MKWLQNNPLGIALAAVGGFLALLILGMAIVWNLPVAADIDDTVVDNAAADTSPLVAGDAGDLNDYRVVDERPVFNESRAPEIVVVEEVVQDATDTTIAVKDAPEVRLTGVIITPGVKIASLTPTDTSQESVMAHEGQSLTGEFVGWQLSAVNPRDVVLESSDGQKLELELLVHDETIKEPPKPEPKPQPKSAAKTAQADKTAPGKTASEADDEEPLSRAEQIRQRIAERREELRREQEAQSRQAGQGDRQSGQGNRQSGKSNRAESNSAESNSAYQNAIRATIKSSRKDSDSNEDQDG